MNLNKEDTSFTKRGVFDKTQYGVLLCYELGVKYSKAKPSLVYHKNLIGIRLVVINMGRL